ncbi:enhancer of split m8 protein-like [Episyrphus balteatus]|uniref:enhancer of split m8 protein-like n=1 Tax=Episyrphus balteatus TaxID=286459 RepID=UPI0024856EBA|nr:enhancer of split m8 protein-like [Episyrphus balteatus]
MEYVSKTQLYLKVKKPLLERQRRARINKCLDSMKQIIAELQNDNAILRMDKAEMLEATIAHLRKTQCIDKQIKQQVPVDGFRNGYVNAANEVSRVLASTRGLSAELGKAIMTHLGCRFVRLQEMHHQQQQLKIANHQRTNYTQQLTVDISSAPLSPASSGYHSDKGSPASSPAGSDNSEIWRPW